jgi:hypothetical protein
MELFVTIHGLFRWVVAILAIVVLVKYAIGWLGKRPFTDLDRQLGTAYAGAVTIQFVLGLIEHVVYGLIAVALAHMTAMFKNQPDEKRFRNAFFLVLLSVLVILWSVIRLRGGWFGMAYAPF